MTCIVGLVDRNVVWLAGDSAATSGSGAQTIIGDKKVFKVGSFIFGVCGSPKVMDAIKYRLELPQRPKDVDDRGFIGSTFADAFKTALDAGGCVEGDQFSGEVLVGYNGGLYRIQGNFQVITSSDRFAAVGSGADIALGAMHSNETLRDPKKRLFNALEASTRNNATVRPPYSVVSVKKGK